MFDNIGNKIKSLVKTIFVIEFVLLIIFALIFPRGFIISMFGIFLAWVSSFVLYGYGELIDNLQTQTRQNEIIIKNLKCEKGEDLCGSAQQSNLKTRVTKSEISGFKAMTISEDDNKEV